MNDWELLSAYVQGDHEAFASLVQKYFPMVFSAAVRQVTDRGLAEEIAQSVFILLSRKAARLSSGVVLAGWLLRTTRFVARDALKQMNRRQKREQQAAERAALQQETDPARSALAPLVDEALLALSGREQACVVARFFQGRSFREIGEGLGISEDTAQKRVSRSLDKMRAFLERRGLKIATASIAGLLSVDFAQAAGPGLVTTALSAVKAGGAGQAATGGSVALADSVARALAWRSATKLAVSAATGFMLLVGGALIVWPRMEPAVPVNTAFQITDSRIEGLGRAWSRMAVLAAQLIRGYPQGPPAAGDPRAGGYQRDSGILTQETSRILAGLGVVMAERSGPAQLTALAELLTVELRENIGLSRRQQAAVFGLVHDELTRAAAIPGGVAELQRNRATLGPRLKAWLSLRQQQQFESIYGEDSRGLFALLFHLQ